MNRFWGQNSGGSVQKLSRDENQMLALNYENLCDADYLNRLFTVQSGDQVDIQGQQAQQKDNESWVLTADTAEDIIVFGDDVALGKYLLQKRLIAGITSSASNHDVLSILVQRQVVVFENISRLVEARCSQQEKLLKECSSSSSSSSSSVDQACSKLINSKGSTGMNSMQSGKIDFSSIALSCALRALNLHSKNQLLRSSVDPILSLLVTMYQERASASEVELNSGVDKSFLKVNETHLSDLREILCNGVEHGIELFAACLNTYEKKNKQTEEHLKLAFSCAYGLLTIGVFSKCPGDTMMAFFYLTSLSMLLDECTANVHNDRELEISSSIKTENEMNRDFHEPRMITPEPIINENEDVQKTQLKLKLKLKTKDNNLISLRGGKVSHVPALSPSPSSTLSFISSTKTTTTATTITTTTTTIEA